MDLGITVTDAAKAQMQKLLQKAPAGTEALRLSIKATGCSGNSYKMAYVGTDETGAQDDIIAVTEAVRLHIPKISSWMLIGMRVDYVTDDLGNSRFDFINPNETGRCGCGESFQVGKTL